MSGKEIRLGKLFSEGKNAVVVAIDHGAYFGPMDGLIDLPQAASKLTEADAILLTPGMLPHVGAVFAKKGAPLAIIRLNWATTYGGPWKYDSGFVTIASTPGRAAASGADLILASLTLHTGHDDVDKDNVGNFAQIVDANLSTGMPLVGEVFPLHTDLLKPEELDEQIYIGCRIAAELGADLIKTFYTLNFSRVTRAIPIPVLALGNTKTPKEIQALELAARAVDAGARGVVFGRNVVQAKDPSAFLGALKAVVKDGVNPESARKDFGLPE